MARIPDDLVAVKMLAFELRPFFGSAYHSLIPVEAKGLGTVGVDEFWRLYYDPAVFTEWTMQEQVGAMYHEISHLLRDHPRRAKAMGSSVNHRLWNIAADLEINDDILEEIRVRATGKANAEALPVFQFGPEIEAQLRKKNPNWKPMPLCPELLKLKPNLMAEEYYYLLLDMQEKAIKEIEGLLSEKGDPMNAGQGRCGSCATGKKEDHEHGMGPSNGNDDDQTPGLSETEGEILRRQVASDIKAQAGRKAGSVPAGWERWADNILQPQVNYMAWLRAAMHNAIAEAEGKLDYAWTRRSRRQGAYANFIMPGMTAYKPKVGVGVDTSGSMSEKQLGQCLGEIKGMLAATGYSDELMVVSCDAAVHGSVQRITRIDQLKLKGGGGTDMGVALKALDEARPRLDLKILLTDCETPWPQERPKGTIVIVKVEGSGAPPPWPCHLVEIKCSPE